MTIDTQTTRPKGADEKFCSECGAVIKQKAEICPHCGCRQLAAPILQQLETRSKSTAALLALLLGGLGIHKFYLGQKWAGIAYIVFCWTFIPAVLALLEGINFLLMSEETFKRKYSAP